MGEAGIFLDLDAPALVVRQVHLQRIELQRGHYIHQPFDLLLGEEMAGHIEQQATPFEPGLVFDLNAGDRPVCAGHRAGRENCWRHQLQQGLCAIKQAHGGRGTHDDPVHAHGQLIAFGAQARLGALGGEQDRSSYRLGLVTGFDLEFVTGALAQSLGQKASRVLSRRVHLDSRPGLEFERTLPDLHFLREGKESGGGVSGKAGCRHK